MTFTDEQIEAGARSLRADIAAEAREHESGLVLGPWSAASARERDRYRRWARAVAEGLEHPDRNFEIRTADWRGN